jgi:hypothetical protein
MTCQLASRSRIVVWSCPSSGSAPGTRSPAVGSGPSPREHRDLLAREWTPARADGGSSGRLRLVRNGACRGSDLSPPRIQAAAEANHATSHHLPPALIAERFVNDRVERGRNISASSETRRCQAPSVWMTRRRLAAALLLEVGRAPPRIHDTKLPRHALCRSRVASGAYLLVDRTRWRRQSCCLCR